jgi:UDP-N-acetylmuramoylalanine--D-glutamate ligase
MGRMDLKGKRVTVMGLGLHGGALGTIDWLYQQGAAITVTDMKNEQELASSVEKLKKYSNIHLVLGGHREENFTDTDLVIRNPAVPRSSKYLTLARDNGVPIEMDSSLFFNHCPSKNIIGITGSKGKTTATHAVAHLLKSFDSSTVAVGLDGVSPLKELPRIKRDSPVVFELSSWRLEALQEHKISPHLAVVTSLYPDHLNTYASFDEYVDTKKTIIRYQTANDSALLNYDDPLVRKWEHDVPGKLYWFSLENLTVENGIFSDHGMITVSVGAQRTPIIQLADLPLRFAHERRNMLPAILIAYLYKVPLDIIKQAVSNMRSLPHRLETVGIINDVLYVNDSAATMPDATVAALSSLAGKTLVHILGGGDKKLSYDELARAIALSKPRALIFLPGSATEKMREQLLNEFQNVTVTPRVVDAISMTDAVSKAHVLAQPGDVVLLSPGATSFGLFQHEFDRGNQFKTAVAHLQSV